jgi:hypothetical protein
VQHLIAWYHVLRTQRADPMVTDPVAHLLDACRDRDVIAADMSPTEAGTVQCGSPEPTAWPFTEPYGSSQAPVGTASYRNLPPGTYSMRFERRDSGCPARAPSFLASRDSTGSCRRTAENTAHSE